MNNIFVVMEMLKPAMITGCVFEVGINKEGNYEIDLNTRAKSGCVLRLENGLINAYRRYDRVDVVTCFDDILDLVHDCNHGRDFFNEDWLKVFDVYEMSRPF